MANKLSRTLKHYLVTGFYHRRDRYSHINSYQIEHHMWPNLSMLSYQKSAPQVQEICRRYGVPYIKQNVFWRLKKTVDIMVGNTSMRQFPESYEQAYLEKDALAEAAALKSQ